MLAKVQSWINKLFKDKATPEEQTGVTLRMLLEAGFDNRGFLNKEAMDLPICQLFVHGSVVDFQYKYHVFDVPFLYLSEGKNELAKLLQFCIIHDLPIEVQG